MIEGRLPLCLCTFGQHHARGGQEHLVGANDEGDRDSGITLRINDVLRVLGRKGSGHGGPYVPIAPR
jgi:hypothetical protein